MPLPAVLAAQRSGALAGVKTVATTTLLLFSETARHTKPRHVTTLQTRPVGPGTARRLRLASTLWHTRMPPPFLPPSPHCCAVLMGPVRAVTYLLVHGLVSITLGTAWALHAPWWASVPAGAAARRARCVFRQPGCKPAGVAAGGYSTFPICGAPAQGSRLAVQSAQGQGPDSWRPFPPPPPPALPPSSPFNLSLQGGWVPGLHPAFLLGHSREPAGADGHVGPRPTGALHPCALSCAAPRCAALRCAVLCCDAT
jgi:hypothetical protein